MKDLSDKELHELIKEPESQRIERKEVYNKYTKESISQTICAFANDLHESEQVGLIFIGVRDNGEIAGLEICDELIQKLVALKLDGRTLPIPDTSVRQLTTESGEVAVIIVQPSPSPPIRFKNTIWVRVGSSTHKARREDERKLLKKKHAIDLPYDVTPIYSAGLEDLSRLKFESEYLPNLTTAEDLAANDRTYIERLLSSKLIDSPDEQIPTFLGLMVLGTSPQDYIQDAYIQFLLINGTKLHDEVLDAKDYRGNLADQLSGVEAKLEAHNFSAYDILSAPTHTITNTYPMAALLQILYNAVMHRDYERVGSPVKITWFDDRIEIINPGECYGNIAIDTIGKMGFTAYRNPNLAAAMSRLGFAQQFGRGIPIARDQLRRHGHPEPEFEAGKGFFSCVIRAK
ncbi:MAG: putative DNA binding domain-containing protein [Gammaproteobacteria bacterium]|nr:putative DNA binding domain-containing protein [Gammaproteobacteria bacterium]